MSATIKRNMTETTFTARFFKENGGRSKTTIAHSKELLINTMKHLLIIFDDWDGFEIETNGKVIYKYLKDYETKRFYRKVQP